MEIKTENKKSLIIFFSFFITCMLLVSFLVVPMVKKVYQQKDSLEENKLILKKDQENSDWYKKDLEYLKENPFFSNSLAVNENDRIEMIKDLENIADEKKLELKIEMYNPAAVKKVAKEDAPSLTFLKLSLSGKYENFLVFLYKLQNFKYAVNIDRLMVENFDDSKIKNIEDDILLEDLPEIESELIISFK